LSVLAIGKKFIKTHGKKKDSENETKGGANPWHLNKEKWTEERRALEVNHLKKEPPTKEKRGAVNENHKSFVRIHL